MPIEKIAVTDLSEITKNEDFVVLDFFAEWCGPCKMLSGVLEEISTEYEGKIKIYKVDMESNSSLFSEYGVSSIPTLLFFKNSVLIEDKIVGMVPKKQITDIIDKEIYE